MAAARRRRDPLPARAGPRLPLLGGRAGVDRPPAGRDAGPGGDLPRPSPDPSRPRRRDGPDRRARGAGRPADLRGAHLRQRASRLASPADEECRRRGELAHHRSAPPQRRAAARFGQRAGDHADQLPDRVHRRRADHGRHRRRRAGAGVARVVRLDLPARGRAGDLDVPAACGARRNADPGRRRRAAKPGRARQLRTRDDRGGHGGRGRHRYRHGRTGCPTGHSLVGTGVPRRVRADHRLGRGGHGRGPDRAGLQRARPGADPARRRSRRPATGKPSAATDSARPGGEAPSARGGARHRDRAARRRYRRGAAGRSPLGGAQLRHPVFAQRGPPEPGLDREPELRQGDPP